MQSPHTKAFDSGAAEIESLLPAANFAPSTGSLESALSSISNLLGHDDTKRGLGALLSRRTTGTSSRPSDRLAVLDNIRRWALEGLRDGDLLSKLGRGPLVAPDPATAPRADSDETAAGARGRTKASRSITPRQARCVLANAFVGNCVDVMAESKDPWNRGGLDFGRMLRNTSAGVGLSKMECLLTYFDVCAALEGTEDDDRTIAFEVVRFVPLSAKSFRRIGCGNNDGFVGEGIVLHTGTMESPTRETSAFVNFANANYGYGKFTRGCTQEEILLMCCPELIVGMLFIGKMKDSEVVNVRGVRRFCKYAGYLDSFRCLGPLGETEVPPIATVLTLDACYERHFTEAMLWRDVGKAYHSFLELAAGSERQGGGRPIVSTGKWGCGAFGGSAAHKMLQQAVAAAAAGVDLEFSSFGNHEGCDKVMEALRETRPSVAKVIALLQNCKSRRTFVEEAVQFLHDGEGKTGERQNTAQSDCDMWV